VHEDNIMTMTIAYKIYNVKRHR